jgi:hypothetical protein
MLVACNIAAWQSRRMGKLDSNIAAIDVWVHFPPKLLIDWIAGDRGKA